MASAWTADGRAFRFTAGPFEGRLERTDAPEGFRLILGRFVLNAVGQLHWKMETGCEGSTDPAPDVAYLQLPYVVAPFLVNTPAGIRLTAFFRATDLGVDVDFRLATTEPLENVSLDLAVEWPEGGHRPFKSHNAIGPTFFNRRFPGVSAATLIYDDNAGATLFIAVGEHGEFNWNSTGATLRLFNQPLEKGVILVGRLALRSADAATINRDLADWLDHPSASL